MRISDWSSDVCSSDLKPDEAKVAAFYAKYGADPKRFLSDMRSFSTDAKIKRGQQFMIRTGVSGTPTLVINGKYRARGRSYEEMLHINDQLIAMERAEMQGAAPGATAPCRGARSEERRGGTEGGSTCQSRWTPHQS